MSALFRRQEEAAEFRDELVGLSSYLKHNGIHRKERDALVEYRRATCTLPRSRVTLQRSSRCSTPELPWTR